MHKTLITYGDEHYAKSRERLAEEAHGLGIFDRVRAYAPSDLDDQIRSHPLMRYPRGGGYWVWKPWVVLDALRQTGDGDVVVYVDAGCSLSPSRQWKRYFNVLNRKDMLAFSIMTRCGQYTKRSMLDAFKPTLGPWWGHYFQLAGGVFLVRKTPFTMRFFERFLSLCTEENLIDVRPGEMAAQYPGFIEHRHDQALFSALVYEQRRQIAILTNDFESRHSGQAICASRMGDDGQPYAMPQKNWLDVHVRRPIGNALRNFDQAYWRVRNRLALRSR